MTGDQRAVAWAVVRPLATTAWSGVGALLVVTLLLVLLTGRPELALAMAVPLATMSVIAGVLETRCRDLEPRTVQRSS
jgi:membrane protein implicated in regulation of membrane protease activity